MEQEELHEIQIERPPAIASANDRPRWWDSFNFIPEDPDLWKNRSIFKVPPYIRRHNSEAFEPKVVSFGPYHHGKEHLKPMEDHKKRSLNHFLKRSSCSLKDCSDALEDVVPQLMQYYEHLDEEWRNNKDRFLELMVIDGCFLVEFLLNETQSLAVKDYDDNDPIFGLFTNSNIMNRNIYRDMLLIENQLPLLVLGKLRALQTRGVQVFEDYQEINKLIFNLFGLRDTTADHSFLHVLDVMRQRAIGIGVRSESSDPVVYLSRFRRNSNFIFPSATVLSHTGVNFKNSKTNYLTDINFDGRSLSLSLPFIEIDEDSEALFLNLMALERFQPFKKRQVSSYLALMNALICSAKDVELLRSRCKIINGTRRSDDDIAKMFKELANNPIVYSDDSLNDVIISLNGHFLKNSQTSTLNVMAAELGSSFIQTYCKSPWTAIGLVAGTILLVATVTQAVYAVLQFYQDNRSPTPHH